MTWPPNLTLACGDGYRLIVVDLGESIVAATMDGAAVQEHQKLHGRRALSPSQAIAAATLPHNENASGEAETHRLDPSIYVSPEHSVEEQESLLRRLPLPIAPPVGRKKSNAA